MLLAVSVTVANSFVFVDDERVHQVPPANLYNNSDLKNGDVIKSINSKQINDQMVSLRFE